ncbi:DNA primase [Thermosipho ferrireducens]|uniref:DNA primase n=1 Tax=Thermosipho ferrireducens TaxID=2571116 RepID=A0ABX7S417_9BACT|nr:DNA primase [Thermosipho ferrireducens]QTA37153.1 DNA primase [Thermosipho ferrireducens]
MISRELIEKIKSRVDIVDVVSRYVSLQKVGNNYRALCPFHTETTPSFYVNPSFKSYHCFGCGASGDVINFLKEIEGISFIDALKRLAQEAGIDITPGEKNTFRELYLRFYKELHEMYMKSLNDAAISYLLNRGLSLEDIKKYEFGYSPINAEFPGKVAKKLKIKALKQLGFVGFKDPFAGRVIIPIKDEQGNVIAFGGRILGDGQPKYLNSFETQFFKKSATFFMFDRAKEYIKSSDFAIICEGYFDAIAFHRAELTNSIATLGTAFTKYHAYKLKKLTTNVVLSFDMDDAGIKAALNSIKVMLSMGFNIVVMQYEKQKDPDEILQKFGKEYLVELVKKAIPVEQFIPVVLSKKYDLSNTSAVNLYLKEVELWSNIFSKFPKRYEKFKEIVGQLAGIKNLNFKVKKRSFVQKAKTFPTLEDILIFLYFNLPFAVKKLNVDVNILDEKAKEFFNCVKSFEEENFSISNLSKDLAEYVKEALERTRNLQADDALLKSVEKKLTIRKVEMRIKEIDEFLKTASPTEKKVLLKARMDLVRNLKNMGR